jgi:ankyrin repeat protein
MLPGRPDQAGPWRPILAALVLAAGSLLRAPAQAEESDRALRELAPRSAVAGRGAPVLRLEWERLLRPADRLGPVPQRPQDQALMVAARSGRWDTVLALLQPGGAPAPPHANTADEAGGHALVLAAAAGQVAVVRALLQQGADIERRSDAGFTALGAAAFHGHLACVRLLLRAGADPARLGATGQTALHLAGASGQVAVLDALLRAGVPIDLLNAQRETALDVAGAANQSAAMDLLIQGGADLTMAGRR